jgi:hypothetical protein
MDGDQARARAPVVLKALPGSEVTAELDRTAPVADDRGRISTIGALARGGIVLAAVGSMIVVSRLVARDLGFDDNRLALFLSFLPLGLLPPLFDEIGHLRFPWRRLGGLRGATLACCSLLTPALLTFVVAGLPASEAGASASSDQAVEIPVCNATVSHDLASTRPLFPGRKALPVSGPFQFHADVNRVLDELARYDPPRYREALEYLPKAAYDPAEVARTNQDAVAVSDGYFALDSRDYGAATFRQVFLHEVGHNVRGHTRNVRIRRSLSDAEIEAQADEYAAVVIGEMRHCGLQVRY